mmetsp:Transcript_3836/g.2555  ORF Transcript_3836/g.2555 Transcript_3836/m.2555 type:complete len:98 (+) Transcript_3836:904-1197(+)|eukprot:CAMPEP_0116885414 /NCGR_PEP_ID=MMETSP0463-20121206/18737_1 /TAXON_ID=181622 /ORGANISM="Strombidinopsis sp, Strain SopsisLIS2011" /LENGTH=97 /DNA_ID=CAMNT_0004543757 /DNA_START=845 /DNA_END=1138 /DNA_ORIENTATION=+
MKELKNKFKALKEDYTKKNDENERNLQIITDLNETIKTLKQTHDQELAYKVRRIEELLGEISNLTKEAYSRESTINDKENRINLLNTDISRLNITIE